MLPEAVVVERVGNDEQAILLDRVRTKGDVTGKFDTPSLKGVGGTGPWFHDGRYKNLHDLLVKSDGAMGHTKHLSKDDLDALEAYLSTL
jgi:cytochrome c peroxidase